MRRELYDDRILTAEASHNEKVKWIAYEATEFLRDFLDEADVVAEVFPGTLRGFDRGNYLGEATVEVFAEVAGAYKKRVSFFVPIRRGVVYSPSIMNLGNQKATVSMESLASLYVEPKVRPSFKNMFRDSQSGRNNVRQSPLPLYDIPGDSSAKPNSTVFENYHWRY